MELKAKFIAWCNFLKDLTFFYVI